MIARRNPGTVLGAEYGYGCLRRSKTGMVGDPQSASVSAGYVHLPGQISFYVAWIHF